MIDARTNDGDAGRIDGLVAWCHREGGRHGILRMTRPERRNATSIAMLDALDAGLDRLLASEALAVVTLAGEGRSFCAGLDLGEVQAGGETVHRLLRRLSEVMRRLRRLPVPVVAEVQGAALGGGFGFLCAADLSVVEAKAKIGYPPVSTGLSPALMAPWLMRTIGPSRTRSMMLEGGWVSGRTAHELGVATHVAEGDEALRTRGSEVVANVLSAPGGTLEALKGFLNELDGSDREDEQLDRAAIVSAEVMASDAVQTRLRG